MRTSTLLGILAVVGPSLVLAAATPAAELYPGVTARELEPRKYSPTCNNCTLQNGHLLNCLCDRTTNNITTQVDTSLDLNLCITNEDGILGWYKKSVVMLHRAQ